MKTYLMKADSPQFVNCLKILAILAMAYGSSVFNGRAADQYFAGDGSALNTAKWGASAAGPFTVSFTNGNVAYFAIVNGTGTGATISPGGINVLESFTVTPGGTLGGSTGINPITVSSGKVFDAGSQGWTTSASVGFSLTGPGVFATAGGTFGGGFVLNSGTLIARGINAMGGNASPGSLTINGGAIGANGNRDFATKYSSIIVGGNFQLGVLASAVSIASDTANLTFANNVALGGSSRTITIGANGNYTLSGIISGNPGVGLTVAALPGTTGRLTLSGANTYNGDTTISGGSLALSTGGSIASSPNIVIAGNATLSVTGLTAPLILASGQGISASGTTSAGVIAVTAAKGLTTAADSPIRFTAFNGSTAPLTLSGDGTMTVQSGNPVSVTVANGGTPLAGGDYKLIAKGASGTVSGAPSVVTVNGDGIVNGATATLANTSGELFLHVDSSCTPPTIHNLTGGNGCASPGVTIGLDDSQTGVNYQLFNGTAPVGSFASGSDGTPIAFGNQTAAGTYTVIATNTVGICTATMNGTVVITAPVTPSVTVSQSPPGLVCAAVAVTFTATPISGGTPSYVWKKNGIIVQTGASASYSAAGGWVDGDTIDCQMTSSVTCVTSATADAPQLTMTITTSVTPSVSVVSDHGMIICAGTEVVFTATPLNGGALPTYVWKTNGVQDTAVPITSATYTNSSLANGDTIDCQLLSSDVCAAPTTAEAPQISMTVNPTVTPSVTIVADTGSTICSNTPVTFTATPSNGGATPVYQWKTNNVNVTGQTANTFTTSKLKNLDAVTVVMTPSSEICVAPATATSDPITMTVNPVPVATITATNGVVQDSTGNVASVPDAGVGATYVWTISGGSITAGQSTASLTYTAGSTIGTLNLGCTVTTVAGCSSVGSANIAVHAPILAGWDVSTLPGGSGDYGPSPLPATTSAANLTVVGLTRGVGVVTTGSAAARGWGGVGWNVASAEDAITAEKFAAFTVAANAGAKVSFNAITRFDYRRSGTGATNGMIQYQVGGADTFHDITTVSYSSSANTGGSLSPIDLSGIAALQDVAAGTVVTFRIVNFGATGSTGSWYVYDVANSPAADFEVSGYVSSCAAPTATLAGNASICAGSSADLVTTLTGTQPWSVTWSDGVTSNNITSSPFIRTVNPGATTVYTVTSVSDAANCAVGTFSGSATVTVNPLPTVSVNSATICAGGSPILTATTDASNPGYLWSPGGATTAAITVSPTTTTIYSVTVTDGTTGCMNGSSGTVTVNPLPTVSVNSETICAGGSTTLTATTSASNPSYLWSPGGATTAAITVSPATTTIYSVTITDGTSGCENSSTGTVTVNPAPTITTDIANQIVCVGSEVMWTVETSGSGVTYQWQRDGTNLVEGVNGFTGTTSGTLTNAAAGPEDAVDEAHGYACVVRIGDCTTSSILVSLTVNPLPTVSVNSETICVGGSATLTATTSASNPSYLWSPGGETTAAITVSPATTTIYSVTVTDGTTGCANSGSGTATVSASPTITLDTTNQITCADSEVTWAVVASGSGLTYQWLRDGTNLLEGVDGFTGTATATLTNAAASTEDAVDEAHGYVCVIRIGDCTTSSTLVSLTVNPLPTVSVNSETICLGGSATLTATTSASNPGYLWSPGGETTAAITISPTTTAIYTVTVTDGTSGCVNSGSGTVAVNPLPTVSVNSETICVGGSATLTATTSASNPSYLWSPGGETTAAITVSSPTTTIYSVTVTDGLTGCINSGSGTVTVSAAPTITLDTTNQITCAGSEVTWAVAASGSGMTYQWQRDGTNLVEGVGNFTGTTAATLTNAAASNEDAVDEAHGYVCLIRIGDCTTSSTLVSLTVNPLPTVSVNAATICLGGSATLTATTSASNPSYLWSPGGETTAAITVSSPTTTIYSVTVTDGTTGCANSSTGTVTVNPLPTVSVNSATVCLGDSATLTATTSADSPSYLWSPGGETAAAITVSPAATTLYTVTVTDGMTGCGNSGLGTVTVTLPPTVSVNSKTICAGDLATLTATTSAGNPSYLWSPGGETTAAITVSPLITTIYSVMVTDGAETCAGTGSGTVTVNPLPTAMILPATTNVTCAGEATFTANLTGDGPLTYQWFDSLTNAIAGETNLTLTLTNVHGAAAGNYTVVVTGPFCSAMAVTSLTVDDAVAPVITINGENPVTNECHTAYIDAGATANDACAGSVSVSTNNDVNAHVPGVYTVTYTADDGSGNTNTAVRTVYVEDTVPPTIAILGDNPATNECHSAYVDAGATANDACAGSVTVTTNSTVNANVPGVYTVTYTANDGNGNTNTAARTVYVVDTVAPLITILGANPYTNFASTPFVDPGAIASDACEGSTSVTTYGTVDVTTPGSYTLEYTSMDASGNAATNTRLVVVIALEPPTLVSGQKLSDGSFTVTFSGQKGQPYQLLSSSDAALDMSDWTVLLTGTFGAGPLTYTDTTATNDAMRFYRIVSP